MISKEVLKELIVSNEELILKRIGKIIEREKIVLPARLNKVTVVYGVRRSGKTYCLFNLFRKYKEISLYIDFEDERLYNFTADDFSLIYESFLELKPHLLGKETVFFFDEVQNVKNWEKFSRRLSEQQKVKVFVSGSSSQMMPPELHTALRGRSWSIEISPFSFREYLKLKGIDVSNNLFIYGDKRILVKRYLEEYLRWGGFPEVALLGSDIQKKKVTKEYLEAIFFKDIVERFKLSNIYLVDALREHLFAFFSSKFSLTSFYRGYRGSFPFSKDILFTYYKYFLASMLIFEIKKFSSSVYKRLRNPAKVYLVDTAICRRVSSFDWGRLLENVVFLEMRKRFEEIFYFEEKKECDFVVKDARGKLSAYQVVWELNENKKRREIEGLVEACKALGRKKGIILCKEKDREEEIKTEGILIKVIPVWKWLIV